MNQKRLRVLILADSCNPEWPSLPVVGYKAAKAIADHCDATVVTQIRNKENIEKVGFGAAEVEYVDTEYIARPVYKIMNAVRGSEGSWTTAMAFAYPSYIAFEIEVWKRFKKKILAGTFDVIHRVTPMSPTLPSYLAKKSPVPFVVGPLNGGLKWPKQFLSELREEKEWLSAIRNIYKILPYSRSTYSKAACILTSFEHTLEQVPKRDRARALDFPEVGIDPGLFNVSLPKNNTDKKTVLFAGRLVPYKLPRLVVEAFAGSKMLQQHRLLVVGDGPLRKEMEAIVSESGIEDCVEFVGWKTQEEVGEYMRSSDVFAFPSIRELGAGVVVEALACGLPCAVVDYGAPGVLVDETCGVRVPIGDRASLLNTYAQALESLLEDPANLDELSKNAHERALNVFSWAVKAKKTIDVYHWVLGNTSEKPNFWSS